MKPTDTSAPSPRVPSGRPPHRVHVPGGRALADAIRAALSGKPVPNSVRGTREFRQAFAMRVQADAWPARADAYDVRGDSALRDTTIGHTFAKHGPQNRAQLEVLAARTQCPQGMWTDQAAAEAFLAKQLSRLPKLRGAYKDFDLPRGLGVSVLPSGEVVPAQRVRIVADGHGGFVTAYPFAPARGVRPDSSRVPVPAVVRLSRELGLPQDPPDGQDWAMLHARSSLLERCIEHYRMKTVRPPPERSQLFLLALGSLDALLREKPARDIPHLPRYADFVLGEGREHVDLLRTWGPGPLALFLDKYVPERQR